MACGFESHRPASPLAVAELEDAPEKTLVKSSSVVCIPAQLPLGSTSTPCNGERHHSRQRFVGLFDSRLTAGAEYMGFSSSTLDPRLNGPGWFSAPKIRQA